MSSDKDVDDCILDQAGSLLPHVRRNGHKNMTVGCLSEVPWLLVLLFELLTTETIATELKPFNCLDEQAHTLQMIIDTLEQTLRVPMNHITGIGLANLERRQLSDALQIFADLINHCYPQRRNTSRRSRNAKLRASITPEGRRLTVSQLGTPDIELISSSHSYTPVLSAFSFGGNRTVQENNKEEHMCQSSRESNKSKVRSVRTLNHDSKSRPIASNEDPISLNAIRDDENRTEQLTRNFAILSYLEKVDSLSSSNSSTTLVKHTGSNRDDVAAQDDRDRFIGAPNVNKRNINHAENKSLPTRLFKPHVPITSLSITNNSKQSKCVPNKQQNGKEIAVREAYDLDRKMSSGHSKTCRYKPYNQPSRQTEFTELTEYALSTNVSSPKQVIKYANKAGQPIDNNLKRKSSTTTVRNPPQRSFCRKPSVKSFKSPSIPTRQRPSTYRQGTSAKRIHPSVRDTHKPKVASTKSSDSLFVDYRRAAITTAQAKATNEPNMVLNRPRKPSVMKLNPKPSVVGVYKKPSAPLERRSSARAAVSIIGQTGGSKTRSRIDTITARLRDSDRRHADDGNERVRGKQGVDQSVPPRSFKENDSRISPISYINSHHGRRRPSIVSTKVRKHSSAASISPVAFDRFSRSRKLVRRGSVSPQTTSLCSSIKLLEEFDYVKRRLKQIQIQQREHEEAISQLEHEKVRLEYVLSHVQQYAGRDLHEESSERTDVFKAAV